MRKKAILFAAVLCAVLLASCGASGPKASELVSVEAGADGSYTGTVEILENTAPGDVVYQRNGSMIDASNASQGYVMVAQSGVTNRLKVQIAKEDVRYNYDLNNQGEWEAFPLQMGDGTYTIRIMQNKEDNLYFELFSAQITVTLDSEFAPYLCPNQFVCYDSSSAVVRKSMDLCSNAQTDIEKLAVVYRWITKNISYDTPKAESVQSGYLPEVDAILDSKKGICFDYASVMAAMLRAQGIPTKLVVGTVSERDLNHAWNEVYLQNVGWVTVRIYFEGNQWQRMDPTFEASGASFAKYIGDGSMYTSLKFY